MIWRFFDDGKCEIVYNATLYSPGAIRQLFANFVNVIEALIITPHALVADVKFPRALDDLRQLKIPQKQPWPSLVPNSLRDAFRHIVQQNSLETAIVQGNLNLTYQQVDTLSSILADKIKYHVVNTKPSHAYIAFCIPPSALAVITILAINKVGCAYVPLDVRDPPGRLRTILADSNVPFLVTTNESPSFFSKGDYQTPIVDITGFLDNWENLLSRPIPSTALELFPPSKIACLLYTSGSTGKPKGVRVTQRSITALISNRTIMPFGPGINIAQVTNLAWDAHILDVWVALLSGSALFCFNRFEVLDPALLSVKFQQTGIDVCFFPTALFRHMLSNNPQIFQKLQHLMIGGEAPYFESIQEARSINPDLRITNMYGPTETCVFATAFAIGPDVPSNGPVPIGAPISTARVHVVDPSLRLVPPGVAGELLIGGEGVADGYHNRPQETSKSFVELKFEGLDSSPSVFYRTVCPNLLI